MVSYNTIQEVMKDSIRIDQGMTSVFPQFGSAEEPTLPTAPKFSGAVYCMNNSTVAFIVERVMYVTPYTRGAYKAIREACREASFFVPFSNGDYPKQAQNRWYQLLAAARQTRESEFVDDCKHWCDEHGIGELPNEVLNKCFKIPAEGVDITFHGCGDHTAPLINSACLDSTVVDRLGKFCKNNGRVVFVYRDSSTYVCKGYGIIAILEENGYTEGGLYVPFSNGETINSPWLRSKWESLEKF